MNMSNLPKLFLAASLSLGLAACGGTETKPEEKPAADIKVKITPSMDSVEVMHEGKPFTIVRNQDTGNTVNEAFAKTSRPCPPFCIRPFSLGGDVETVGELEVIDYVKKASDGDASILIVDARTPDWAAKGTIPTSINVPFKDLVRSKGANDVTIADALEQFGAEEMGGKWDFSNAKTLVLFCNGMWCGQSPLAIGALREMGYPESKLKWYRDGMQTWEILGLPTVKPSAE